MKLHHLEITCGSWLVNHIFFVTETLWLFILPSQTYYTVGTPTKCCSTWHLISFLVAEGTSWIARTPWFLTCFNGMSLLIVVEHRRKEDTETQILAQCAVRRLHSDSTGFTPFLLVKTIGPWSLGGQIPILVDLASHGFTHPKNILVISCHLNQSSQVWISIMQ